MKKIYLIFLLLICKNSFSQYWIRQPTGSQNNMGYDITNDASGNTYTTGHFSGATSFGTISLTSTGIIDMFLVKTNPGGTIIWAIHAGGANVTEGLSVCVDGGGNSIVAGFFFDNVIFGTQTLTSSGQKDAFVAKYDPNGTLLWAKKAGGSLDESCNRVTTDNADNILITGEYSSPLFTFGTSTLSSPTSTLDVFTSRLSPSGNILWLKSGTGPYTDRGTQITSDANGDVYVAGEFGDTATFDVTHNNIMYNALFIIKYSSSGQEQWFRWMGSGNTVKMKGLKISPDGNLIALGNFTSSLVYFGFGSTFTLTNNQTNNFFISALDQSGNYLWSTADGSSSVLSAECLAVDNNNNIVVGGTFQCRFNGYADRYGQGVFCSLGFNDCFVGNYNSSGVWQWSRSYGGQYNDYLNGISFDNTNKVAVAGGFYNNLYIPEISQQYDVYEGIFRYDNTNYCSDMSYYSAISFSTMGNSDIYFGKPVNLNRQPIDFFVRSGSVCARDFLPFCVNECQDTIEECTSADLYSNTFNDLFYHPDFRYLWNDGDTLSADLIFTSGIYWVQSTTADGCFTDADSIYALIHAAPSVPLISDNKGINQMALLTQPIYLCVPDSVTLTSTVPPGCGVQWTGGLINNTQITVSTAGVNFEYVTATDSNGCTSENNVKVVISSALQPIIPALYCENDTDRNDTVIICSDDYITWLPFDSLSDPSAQNSCIPQITTILWSVSNSAVTFASSTYCSGFNYFRNFPSAGWYTFTAIIVRNNTCGAETLTVSRNLYVIPYPSPTGTISIVISGNNTICPGDSTLLTAVGGTNWQWNTGESTSSIYADAAGQYTVYSSIDTTNSFGCHNVISGNASINVVQVPQPVASVVPANAVICPDDSVQLTCSPIPGSSYVWQGPDGVIPINDPVIWVNTPGLYYCIRTSQNPACTLPSNTVTAVQYNIPLIITTASAIVCNGSPVTLQIITSPGSIIQWQSPLTGDSAQQTVNVPGIYFCTVTTCNIVTPLSLTVAGSNPVAAVISSDHFNFCTGDTVTLSAGNAVSYLWYPGLQTTQSIEVSQAGQYVLQITDALNCSATDTVNLTTFPNFLSAPFSEGDTLCAGAPVELYATGNSVIHWLDSSLSLVATGAAFNLSSLPSSSYYLLYSDSGGCRSSYDTVFVEIDPCDTIIIPNVITPDGDGNNDYFPNASGVGRYFDINIYNRWGRKIYSGSDSKLEWNGTNDSGEKLNDGVYYYILSVRFYSGRIQKAHGWVMVIN